MRFIVMLILLFAIPILCSAQSICYVPDDFSTIQGAISGSAQGDTIIVRPGTYVENLVFQGKAITLKSESGPAVTVINGNQSGSVVSFESGEVEDSVVEGFTITNGQALKGGGIYCNASSPTVMNNTIAGNGADHYGGGIYCRNCPSPAITNNTITGNYSDVKGGGIHCSDSSPEIRNNTVSWNSAHFCGGIHCTGNPSPTIANNTITGNTSKTSSGGICCENYSSPIIMNNIITGNMVPNSGAGIYCRYSSPTITNNIITENVSDFDGGGIYCYEVFSIITNNTITANSATHGGGIYCWNASPTIVNNMISGNSATLNGGGIRCWESSSEISNNLISLNSAGNEGGGVSCQESSPIITNTTIFENSADGYGGGICFQHDCAPIITNAILWNNSAQRGPELMIGSSYYPSTATINYSDVEGGLGAAYVDPGCTLHWGSSMIETDPLFVDPAKGDFHIQYASPCRNAGDSLGATEPCDFEGDPRIAYGPVDMGADEFHAHLYCTGEATPSGIIQAKFVGLPGTLINGVILGVKIFDPPLPCDYGLWYMDNPMQIITGLGTIPADGISIFPGTIPTVPPKPYTFYLQGVIDQQLTNLCPVQVE